MGSKLRLSAARVCRPAVLAAVVAGVLAPFAQAANQDDMLPKASSFNPDSGLGASFFGMLPSREPDALQPAAVATPRPSPVPAVSPPSVSPVEIQLPQAAARAPRPSPIPAVSPPSAMPAQSQPAQAADQLPAQAQPREFQFETFQSYLPFRQDQLIVQSADQATDTAAAGGASGPVGLLDPAAGAAPEPEPNPLFSLLDIDESELVLPKSKEFRFGPFVLIPKLSVLTGYDSNIAQSSKSSKKDSSTYFLIMPSVQLGLRARSGDYTLSYDNTRWQYTSRSEYNTTNQVLALNAFNSFDVRNSLRWKVVLTDAYEQKGSTDSSAPSANRYRLWRYGGTYRYGAEGARGRIEADVFQSQREYLNNRIFTRSLDYDANEIALRFYARVMPKTSLFVETRNIDTDYRASSASLLPGERDLSNVKRTNSLGATWRATAATSGTLKIGHTKADYSNRRDFSGGAYDLILDWEPRSYSRVELAGRRFVSDTTAENAADYILNRSIGAKWTHDWAGHWQTVLALARLDSDYNGTSRNDLINTRSLALYYRLKQWLSVGIEYSRYIRDSNNNDFDVERTQGGLSLRLNIF